MERNNKQLLLTQHAKYSQNFRCARANKMEFNSLEAFVALIHPESKYEGSGTEGILMRDCIIDTYPTHTTE